MSLRKENEFNFVASKVTFDSDYLHLHLSDGRVVLIPYEIIPSLANATQEQRECCEIAAMGTALHWPKVDEDLPVEGLVLGRKVSDWRGVVA